MILKGTTVSTITLQVGMYIFPQIKILHIKHFFVYQFREEQKSPVEAVSAITLHM